MRFSLILRLENGVNHIEIILIYGLRIYVSLISCYRLAYLIKKNYLTFAQYYDKT